MHIRQRRLLRLGFSVVFALVLAIATIGQGDWSLGSYRFGGGPPSGPLQFNLADSGGLGSYSFVSSVGGIAFAGMATPSAALGGQKVHLQYDGSAIDGSRLRVIVGGRTLRADLPDWLLVPVARYADSKFDSCVSLFGPQTTDTTYDIVYHQEFQNTLVGLRLLQGDMLLFDLSQTWQLPKLGGSVILGLGEVAPQRMDESSAMQIENALANGDFQSWVMTDQGENISFDSNSDRLRIGGLPYYYFWTSDVESIQKQQNDLYQRAQEAMRAGRTDEYNRLAAQNNTLTPTVREVSTLTANLKAERSALRRFNTPVYDVATNVMRYAAFFRYVKSQEPSGWKDFLGELKNVQILPHVTTPTRWAR
jgi:hypothetical protein